MSVLKWESNDEDDYTLAETMQGEYMVCELNGGGWDCMFRDWQLDCKIYETKQAAMDACEADYIARCTEFLTLYDPATHVVVSREAAEHLKRLSDCYHCDDPNCFCGQHEAELRAALEVGE